MTKTAKRRGGMFEFLPSLPSWLGGPSTPPSVNSSNGIRKNINGQNLAVKQTAAGQNLAFKQNPVGPNIGGSKRKKRRTRKHTVRKH